MFTHCIFDENNNELSYFTGKECLDKLFVHLKYHFNRINKIKARPNSYSNPDAYKNNANKTICLIYNKDILTDKPHAYPYYCKKKQDIFMDLSMADVKKEKINYLYYVIMVQNFILD